MCIKLKKEDYMGLYFKFDEKMRYYFMDTDSYTKLASVKQMQGYEMLRIAWIANSVDSKMTEEDMLETVKQNISMETAKVEVEEGKNGRDSVLQKMIEVVRALGENVSPLDFVRGL